VTPRAFSREDFADLTQASPAFESVAAYALGVHVLTGGEPQELDAAYVSADFFRTMGVEPALGRTPGIAENVPGRDQVAVLSDAFWRGRFGSDVGVIGETITLDGAPFVIVGVMPPSFDFPSPDASILIPLSRIGCDNIPCGRNQRFMQVVARIAPGSTVAVASSATNALLEWLEATYPETNEGWGVARVVPLRESVVGDVRPALLILFGAVALVLLIACVNVANLLLARSTTRGREFAIRAALGASRWRVVRQLLTESVVLALAGGAAGFALAYRGVDAVVALSGGSIPRWYEIQPDLRVAAFALALSVFTGVLFGLLPSLAAARADVGDSLNAGGRSGADGGWRQRKRGFLIALEVAMAVVLLTGSGLLIRTFWNLTRVDTGFRAENVLSLSLSMSGDVMSGAERNAYRREIIDRVANLPGVIAAGGSKDVPLHGTSEYYKVTLPAKSSETYPHTHIVSGNYFRALRVPLLDGRFFTNADETDGALVVIVNQAMARQFWPGSSPVGESVLMFDEVVRIVGVVGDVRHRGIVQSPDPAIYLLPHFGGRRSMNLYVRTTADPLPMVDAIRSAIWDVNPDQPISRIATMEDVVIGTIRTPRFLTLLLGAFAGLAVVLAALGVYGVTAYHVSRRTYEVGVRMALGGRAGDVLRLIMGQGLAPVFVGLVIGLIAARGLTRILSNLLFGVGATDPFVFAAVAILLVTVAFLAVYIPARRAAHVDPMIALRAQ
jgi:predicted permease